MGYRIRFALPGPSADWASIQSYLIASTEHEILLPPWVGHSNGSTNHDDCWNEAVNAFEAGEIDLFASLHTDLHILQPGWLDRMVEVAERKKASIVSVPNCMKYNGTADGDVSGALVSCGVVRDMSNTDITELLTIGDLEGLPKDFDAADLGCPGHILSHNTGCILYDLRDERLRATDENGDMRMVFNYPRRNRRGSNGKWGCEGNSEDFYISRIAHELGVPSVITSRVQTHHRGWMYFPNWNRRRQILEDFAAAQLAKHKELIAAEAN